MSTLVLVIKTLLIILASLSTRKGKGTRYTKIARTMSKSDKTGIIWTETTWNPMSGCQKVSEGCKFCYAETIANQYSKKAFPNGFGLTKRPHKLREPFGWKEPTLCFVNSMSDLFWEELDDDYRNRVIDVIEQTPQHEYQVLTKRPENMLKFSKKRKLPANFWAGTTIENERNLHRLEIIKEIDAEIRFISFEPLIGDLGNNYNLDGIDWVITGGESGTHMWQEKWQKARGLVTYNRLIKKWEVKEECKDWIRDILAKCRTSGTHFFHKQWGGSYPEAAGRELDGKTYNEIPRLPGQKKEINNAYLKHLEGQRQAEQGQLVLF